MPHSLPSKNPDAPLSTFTGFFKQATIMKTGGVVVQFSLDAEANAAVLDLASGDGMAVNVTVWETELPDGDVELARMLGLDGAG